MPTYDYFELHRLSDNLIYQFDRKLCADGQMGYQRRDQDFWIIFKPGFGWIAYDEETQSLSGRSWNILPDEQNPDHPPEGEWVSKKGTKSYVYRLVYLTP